MQHRIVISILACFVLSNIGAATISMGTPSPITIKEGSVQGAPKTSSIEATINGHVLTVTFLENLGNVQVEVTTTTGGTVDLTDIWTPTATSPTSPTRATTSSQSPSGMEMNTMVSSR